MTLDRNRVFQVLANYIMNAIKYTTEGKITIGMETDKSGVKIWVKDTMIHEWTIALLLVALC